MRNFFVVVFVMLLAVSVAQRTEFARCAEMNRVYPHGVGKLGAKDKTSGVPVTTFLQNTALYEAIFKKNPKLDRDKDGIACERR